MVRRKIQLYTLESYLLRTREFFLGQMVESVKVDSQVSYQRLGELPAYEGLIKRGFDVALSLVALICVSPFLCLAVGAIVLETKGLPIFMQPRVGRNGKLFNIYKLRTMYVGSDKLGFRTECADDRLTRVGGLLRRLNIDELPQLVNVLMGDMSIIGPRPLSEAETQFLTEQAGFSADFPGLIPRFRPGLVGLEQVNRQRNLTYSERFQYNRCYEAAWSLNADLRILLRAIYLCSPVCIAVGVGALLLLLIICH